jgi:hypothetical protein
MSSCGERRDVRHLAAGDERGGGVRGQAEQLAQPPGRNLLDDRGTRAGGDEARILVPGRGEPVGGERSRQRAADDEAEVAAGRDADDPGLGRCDQLGEDLLRSDRLVPERDGERLTQLLDRRGGTHGPLVERVEEPARVVGRAPEQAA